eukprot:767924-Hanusia_phi.AAC.5
MAKERMGREQRGGEESRAEGRRGGGRRGVERRCSGDRLQAFLDALLGVALGAVERAEEDQDPSVAEPVVQDGDGKELALSMSLDDMSDREVEDVGLQEQVAVAESLLPKPRRIGSSKSTLT